MILVSSIIVATLIGVTEKITQRTDRTAEDARMKNVNTIIITGAWVYDSFDDMLFMMEFGPAGEAVNRVDVSYVLTCTDKDGTFNFRAAVLGDSRTATGQQGSDIFVWEVGTWARNKWTHDGRQFPTRRNIHVHVRWRDTG